MHKEAILEIVGTVAQLKKENRITDYKVDGIRRNTLIMSLYMKKENYFRNQRMEIQQEITKIAEKHRCFVDATLMME